LTARPPGGINGFTMAKAANGSYITVPRLRAIPGLFHGFGIAAFTESDLEAAGKENGVTPVILDQVHSDKIHRIAQAPKKKISGDALMTQAQGLALVIKTADCLPVLIVDEKQSAVAAVHCGWRGTRKKILDKAVREMAAAFGSDPGSLLVALGPCIGPECYEVGRDVRDGYEEAGFPDTVFWPSPTAEGKFLFNLREANRWLLGAAGVRSRNVFSVDVCTRCRPELMSYRRDKDKTGRMFAFVAMTAPLARAERGA
jgi:polyphenol oxidase